MRRRMRTGVLIGILTFGLTAGSFIIEEKAHAVPIFTRKYNTSCTTCHIGFPKINAFGEAFKNNGYRLPEDEVFVKEPPVWLGSEAYKRVWPKAIWPGSIPGTAPFSLRVIGQFHYNPENRIVDGKGTSSFEFPHEIEFLSLGTMGDNLAFNFGFAFQDEGERSAVERVYLEYSDVLSGHYGIPKDLINIRGGFLDLMAMPFSTHNQNVLGSRPTIYDFRISSEDQPRIRDSQSGIEIFGIVNKRFRYATGAVNGVAEDGATGNFVDNNTEKDIYVRAEYKFGGLPFSGAPDSGSGDTLASSFSYFDQGPSVTIGSTGYFGVNQIDAATDTDSEYYRIMGFLRANRGRYNMDLVYLSQWDDAAAGQFNNTIDEDISTWGFYAEGTAYVYPWLALALRYDRLNVEHVSVLGLSNPVDNSSRLTIAMPMYARPNLRIVPEATLGLSDKDGNISDSFKIRVDFAY